MTELNAQVSPQSVADNHRALAERSRINSERKNQRILNALEYLKADVPRLTAILQARFELEEALKGR